MNPDGTAADTRQNAHGVDLNRNFPYLWQRVTIPTYDSGPHPESEPETRIAERLIRRVAPAVTVWYHQHLDLVDMDHGDHGVGRRYAQLAHMRALCLGPLPGTATRWANHTFPGSSAFVVELPAGLVSRGALGMHLRAVRGLERGERTGSATACTASAASAASAATAATAPTAPTASSVPRPRIVHWWIPFGPARKRETAAYAQRHYGINSYQLLNPHVIVEHLSDASTAQADYDTFAPDSPDAELGELPGICAHFVIDGSGTIYQMVPTSIVCRHTVGLNYTAIGIEHTGYADGDVLSNPRQLAASLALTRFLRCRFKISLRNVIGHNESLSSPYHHERVVRLRNQTHNDFHHPSMARYRRALARLGGC
jgi:beta-N-acetylhexosaminidase